MLFENQGPQGPPGGLGNPGPPGEKVNTNKYVFAML